MKLPFWLMPASWGLKGNSRKKAELEYKYSGKELEKYLFMLENENISDPEIKEQILKFDFELGNLTKKEFREQVLDLFINDKVNFQIRELNFLYEDKQIEIDDYELELATIKEEPFIKLLDSKLEKNKGLDGLQLKVIWNEYFVDYLHLNGYVGNEDEVIKQYIMDLLRESNMEDI